MLYFKFLIWGQVGIRLGEWRGRKAAPPFFYKAGESINNDSPADGVSDSQLNYER